MRDKATRQGITETECAPRAAAAASSFTNKALLLVSFWLFLFPRRSLLFFIFYFILLIPDCKLKVLRTLDFGHREKYG